MHGLLRDWGWSGFQSLFMCIPMQRKEIVEEIRIRNTFVIIEGLGKDSAWHEMIEGTAEMHI